MHTNRYLIGSQPIIDEVQNKPYTIGIVGNGFVGQATKLLKTKTSSIIVYDIDPTKCEPSGITMENLCNQCDVIFVCVPTPSDSQTKKCSTSIVEKVISDIRHINPTYDSIVVRSTVPVGFCKQFQVHHMPEFLTEANWKRDFYNCKLWIFGLFDNARGGTFFKDKISSIFDRAYEEGCISCNNIKFVDPDTSEFVKYGRNCYLAMKLSLCNEYYDFCDKKNIDYDEAIHLIGSDDRIGTRYTNVPGPDGKRGWGGTCFPKDTVAFVDQLTSIGCESYMVQAAIDRNEKVDRVEKDWTKDENKGRTFI